MTRPRHTAKRLRRIAFTIVAAAALAGCGNVVDRLADVGSTPELAPIENPVQREDYVKVSLPMPPPESPAYRPNSLWRAGARGFFKDQRANRVGDVVTVLIQIQDDASVDNETTRTRDNNEDASIGRLFGYEASLNRLLPQVVAPASLVDIDSDSLTKGTGKIVRKDTINLRIAAIVTQVLPNGNLVIHGSQQVRVNFEVRELGVDGVIRREDIGSDNTVRHDQIAEARIVYGGRGTLSDVQRPRYGQELFDIIYPF